MNQSILWVFDRIGNFKGSKSVRYILAKKLNIHIIPWNTQEKINYSMYKKVIFDFNEDLIGKGKKIVVLERMATQFLSENKNGVLFNNPRFFKHITDKYDTYQMLKKGENEVVKIPKFACNISKDIDYYPVILKSKKNASNDGKDVICKNYKQLIYYFNKNKFNKDNIIISQLVNSYDNIEKKFHKVRWMVFGNKIIEQQVCFNKVFNVHNKNTSTKMFLKAKPRYEEFKNRNINEIQKFLDFHKSVFGEGFICFDVIFDFVENKIYLCETGIKFYDHTAKYMPKEGRKEHFINEMIKYLT